MIQECYWAGNIISFCLHDVFIHGAYYGGFSFSSDDLVGPLFEIVLHRLSCRTVDWQSQDVSISNSFQFLSVMVIDSGFVPVILYSLFLNILRGHWIPITFLSCLLWKRFSFLWSSFDTPQFMQLYNSILFTSVSYSRILVVSFFFQFFFQMVSFFAGAIVTNSFLLWMTSRPTSFDPSFIMFLHSLTSSFDIVFTVVYSVFSSFTNRFLLFIISFSFP